MKLIADHPLVEYVEDPFASHDIPAFAALQEKLKEQGKVKVAVKQMLGEAY